MAYSRSRYPACGEAALFDVPPVTSHRKTPPAAAKPVPRPLPAAHPEPAGGAHPMLDGAPHPVLDGMEEVGSGLLDRFDAMQRVAASAPGGPMLVVAGPGTGKTLVLTTRIAYLVKELGVPAADCLAVCFDTAAAEQLSVRLTALLGPDAADVTVTSFAELHDACPAPWVFVDEYQDLDDAAYRQLRRLCPREGNLFAVADPDQAVHTDARYALRFADDHPDPRTVRLSRHYRSTAPILAAAVQAISPTSLVRGRHLDPARRDDAPAPIGRYAATDADDEAGFVAATATRLVSEGVPASGIAVLYRDHAQAAPVADALAHAGVPVRSDTGPAGVAVRADAAVTANPPGAPGPAEQGGAGVTLLTLRAAKGREFPVVFLIGCGDGVLPTGDGADPEHVAAERRLFFVGLTRAQHRLHVSYQRQPSHFLDAIDPGLYESLNPATAPDRVEDLQLRLL
ncbi:MAG: UvrD-helicase domain-containing protein [Micromonosporaceae bacterium]